MCIWILTVKALCPQSAIWHDRSVNIGTDNGLVPSGTKPLSGPMLIYHWWDPSTFTFMHFMEVFQGINHHDTVENNTFNSTTISSKPEWVNALSASSNLLWCICIQFMGVWICVFFIEIDNPFEARIERKYITAMFMWGTLHLLEKNKQCFLWLAQIIISLWIKKKNGSALLLA